MNLSNMFMNNIDLTNISEYLINTRRHLHQYPETAFQEFETTKFIQQELNNLEIINYKITDTGIIGIIGDISNPCIALRADIDALPISEETGLPYSSLNEGKMHACGHDFHTAILLGAANYLKSIESELSICVKLIFQPAEEMIPGGAKTMIDKGVLKNPIPQFVFGQHIHPSIQTGRIEMCYGPIMASSDELYWTIKGKSSHAATPHLGNDPILASAYLISHLQNVITKFRNPLQPGVLSITSIHSGTATNILPDEVKVMGTFRAYNNEWRYKTLSKIEKVSQSVCDIYSCESVFTPKLGFPAVINHEIATNIAKQSAMEAVGNDNFAICEPMMWGEDFAYYGENIPACFWFLGVKNIESMSALHNSKLSPDESALIIGTKMMINCVLNSKDYLK